MSEESKPIAPGGAAPAKPLWLRDGWLIRILSSACITVIGVLAAVNGDTWFAMTFGFLAGAAWTALLGMWVMR